MRGFVAGCTHITRPALFSGLGVVTIYTVDIAQGLAFATTDALMADATLPDVPLVRVAVDDLTGRMMEYVVLHVLMHHRQEVYLRQSQRDRRWAPRHQWPAGAISVGIMGLGTLGTEAAQVLRRIGFQVLGWSRTPRQVEGGSCFHGRYQ